MKIENRWKRDAIARVFKNDSRSNHNHSERGMALWEAFERGLLDFKTIEEILNRSKNFDKKYNLEKGPEFPKHENYEDSQYGTDFGIPEPLIFIVPPYPEN